MIKLLGYLWENYGLDAVQIAVIVGLAWKFVTNHWKHFTEKVNRIDTNVQANSEKISEMSDRVSKIEGKLEKR